MNVQERIKRVRLIEKMNRNQTYCKKLGIENKSTFYSQQKTVFQSR